MRKRRSKRIKWWIIAVMVLILLTGVVITAFCMAEKPPVIEMEETRAALSEAEKLDAEVYSRSLYREAKLLYDSAMSVWKRENEKLIIFRKFEPVVVLAAKSKLAGQQAAAKAKEARRNSKSDLKAEIELLRQEMTGFEKLFSSLPVAKRVKDEHSKGKLLLNAAEIAFDKGEYSDGQSKSKAASALIRSSYQDARKMLSGYFEQLPQWQEQLKEAIAYSKKHRTEVIVVEKIPGLCDLYSNGVKKYSFKVEFGRNWIGDKKYEGDYATPEGEYKVVKKLQGGSTKYYKALLMNYPNKQDRKRFNELKKKGEVARSAGIGSLIEIHGSGGRGANWTNGCVALVNKDMDVLYRNVGNSTPIWIIGASEPLDKILSPDL